MYSTVCDELRFCHLEAILGSRVSLTGLAFAKESSVKTGFPSVNISAIKGTSSHISAQFNFEKCIGPCSHVFLVKVFVFLKTREAKSADLKELCHVKCSMLHATSHYYFNFRTIVGRLRERL